MPNYKDVVQMVESDVGDIGLGLTHENRELLRTTNIVFHGAATVRFEDPIRKTAAINVRGVKEMIHLAKEMRDLKVINSRLDHCGVGIISTSNFDFFLPGFCARIDGIHSMRPRSGAREVLSTAN